MAFALLTIFLTLLSQRESQPNRNVKPESNISLFHADVTEAGVKTGESTRSLILYGNGKEMTQTKDKNLQLFLFE